MEALFWFTVGGLITLIFVVAVPPHLDPMMRLKEKVWLARTPRKWTFWLLSEKEGELTGTGHQLFDATVDEALVWGRQMVEEMDRTGQWPEGHDAALFIPETGRMWYYIGDLANSGWEEAEENTSGK